MQLVVDKIAKAFGIHEIFKNVSFMIEQGEHVGLVGVNGSGKTTLLRCLLNPDWIDEASAWAMCSRALRKFSAPFGNS